MGNVARSLIEGVPVALQGSAGINVQRSAVLLGKVLQRSVFGLKLAVGIVVKVIQGAVPS